MNKQEAIEKLKSKAKSHWLDEAVYGDNSVKAIELNMAIDIVNQIDEPEKPTVPQYVADWIEWCKNNNVTLLGAMSPIDELGLAICNDKKVKSLDASKWTTRNQETFAKAWFFGYEVEKEKLYTVELPDPNGGGHVILCKNGDGTVSIAFSSVARWRGSKNVQLTESEIKKDFEWAWEFAEEVKE